MYETETFRNEGPLWPCGCLAGSPGCDCSVPDDETDGETDGDTTDEQR